MNAMPGGCSLDEAMELSIPQMVWIRHKATAPATSSTPSVPQALEAARQARLTRKGRR